MRKNSKNLPTISYQSGVLQKQRKLKVGRRKPDLLIILAFLLCLGVVVTSYGDVLLDGKEARGSSMKRSKLEREGLRSPSLSRGDEQRNKKSSFLYREESLDYQWGVLQKKSNPKELASSLPLK